MHHPSRLIIFLWLFSLPAMALPSAGGDFWRWLAPQFRLQGIEHAEIDRWEARWRQRELELQVILARGSDFLYPLALAVRDRGMPMELALLPVIESQLDPTAVSRSGARGLWQLLPATAEHLGLRHDWWMDESADFSRSTEAALNYLEYLNDRFGSWMLTLAAYNAGEGRIHGQMRRRQRNNQSFDFWDLDLQAETRAYVPKLLALARVVARPGPMQLPPIRTQRQFTRLNTGGPLDVMQIAELADIDVEAVYRLNPQLLRWALPPDGPAHVYLPTDRAKRFRLALSRLPASARHEWRQHVVAAGESLGLIAQRHGASIAMIKHVNGLKSDKLRAGQTLMICTARQNLPRPTLNAALRGGRINFARTRFNNGLHEVRSGESLWTIARHYGTSVDQLQTRNPQLINNRLMPGQLIKVGDADRRQRLVYTVQPGDALSLIAERFRVSVADIRSWNALNHTVIRPGQQLELRLPAHSG